VDKFLKKYLVDKIILCNFVEQTSGRCLKQKVMGQLVFYNIKLEDGRKGLNWEEDGDDHFGDCNITQTLLDEATKVVESTFGSKVISYEWIVDEEEDEEEED
jgi:hypothetical protein